MGFVGKLVYTKQYVYCKESLCKHCNTYWIKGTVMYSLHKKSIGGNSILQNKCTMAMNDKNMPGGSMCQDVF